MYKINKEGNSIEQIKEVSFKSLGFKEREHLQEWIAKNPTCLNEEILIIQKEFNGFNDTKERLDLLALDKQGNLIIIENKLDDSGKDVTWQVLKYASYCSNLNSTQILNIFDSYLKSTGNSETAEEILVEFFGNEDYEATLNNGDSQRIIMVSANFRKEVTSTVLWLMNYGLRIQCFKTTPYQMGDSMFLNFEQILPMQEMEEMIIGMANKNRDTIKHQEVKKERHLVRLDFWRKMIDKVNKTCSLFQNVSPSKDHWLNSGSGMSGVGYTAVATKSYVRVELSITRNDTLENKQVFDYLYDRKEVIEKSFGSTLIWERLDEKKMSRVKFQLDNVSIFDKEDWENMTEFLAVYFPKFEVSFKKYLKEINNIIKQ